MIKAIIFDMDGVIIDSEQAHLDAFNKVLARFNVKLTREKYNSYFGRGALYIMKEAFRENNIKENVVSWTKKKDEYYRESVKDDMKPFMDSLGLIRRIHGKLKTAIASSAVRENIKLAIEKLDIGRYMECFAGGDEVEMAKPSPEIYILCAKRLKLRPEECVVVEDAVLGIQAAKSAGMKCIAITNTSPKEKLSKADIVVDTLDKVDMKMIKGLEE